MAIVLKMPDISELRHRIVFQSLSRVPDGQGGFTETWSNFYECWAKMRVISTSELNLAQRMQDFYTFMFIIRWPEVVLTSEMQVIFEGRAFQVKTIYKYNEQRFFGIVKCDEKGGS